MTLINVYTIENLSAIRCKYKLFRVRGISSTSDDYDKNVQLLSDKLSSITQSPCVSWKENDSLFIAQPSGCKHPPDKVPLIGTEAIFEETDIEREIKYESLTDQMIPLALRFLQHYLARPLDSSPILWRPHAGAPFYQKTPEEVFSAISSNVNMYKGFTFRIILLSGNKIGVCVEVSRMYAAKHPLPAKITIDKFRKYKNKKCIYEYGNLWYVIRIHGLSDYSVSELTLPTNGKTLFQDIYEKSGNHKSQLVLTMPPDSSVITYKTTTGQIRNAPSVLCRLAFKTNHHSISKYHSKTIIPPHLRRREIEFFVTTYLRNLNFQGTPIMLSDTMMMIDPDVLVPPDLEFGNNKILSLRNSNGKVCCDIENFGKMKITLLDSPEAGYFTQKPLDQQYIVMPKSIMSTFGEAYIEDIKSTVKNAYSPDGRFQYNPSIIEYDDSKKSIYALGNEIISKIESNIFFNGFGLVVIPKLESDDGSKEDALANLLMSELRKKDIFFSISHTEVPTQNYVRAISEDGLTVWQIAKDQKRANKFKNYLNNLVLNKILLLNSCWPFVLATPLHADVLLGIDIKNTTASLVAVLKDGKTFVFQSNESEEKERLSKKRVENQTYRVLERILEGSQIKVKNIVVNRDGKVFPGEIEGVKAALIRLKEQGFLEEGYQVTFAEVRKSSRTPFRFFEINSSDYRGERTYNPKFGTYKIFGSDTFLCTTGSPFRLVGTTRPLHIIRVEGPMDMKEIVEDIFSLTNLTWTKIDFCSRLPITIKMADIRLREIAGDYDSGTLQFGEDD